MCEHEFDRLRKLKTRRQRSVLNEKEKWTELIKNPKLSFAEPFRKFEVLLRRPPKTKS